MQFVKSWRVFGLPRKRYIQWDACTADTPLVSDHGIPQGDAFSPLALSCLLTAGLSFVKRQTDHLPGEAKHYIYIYISISLSRSLSVDDRSWTSSKASKVIAILQAWFAWSQAIGLCENPSKTPLTALTPNCAKSFAIALLNNNLSKMICKFLVRPQYQIAAQKFQERTAKT